MEIVTTGSKGTIGTILRKKLSAKYHIRSFTLKDQGFESIQVDFSNRQELEGISSGLEALIHLVANPRPEASWKSVKRNNIEATYNVFHECQKSGVKKIIFASTNHTQHGDTLLTTPETLDPSKNRKCHLKIKPILILFMPFQNYLEKILESFFQNSI